MAWAMVRMELQLRIINVSLSLFFFPEFVFATVLIIVLSILVIEIINKLRKTILLVYVVFMVAHIVVVKDLNRVVSDVVVGFRQVKMMAKILLIIFPVIFGVRGSISKFVCILLMMGSLMVAN